ncbi:MAG TPA: hypothetical protein VFN10_08210 [Thermoanaerobaculia bacterium]|nr:hypothetical protein [Thermoanaerobaculia bacterium]
MTDQLLSIGGITLALRCDDARVDCRFVEPFSRFVVEEGSPDIELHVTLHEEELASRGSLVFDSGAVWKLLRDGDGHRIECKTPPLGDTPYRVATIDSSFTRGEVHVRPNLGGHPLNYPLDEVLFANLLGRGRGVELHGCGIVARDGRGHLFVGQSGAGKTTTAGLWGDDAADVVSDDRVIVRVVDEQPVMFGTPWHGEAQHASAAPSRLDGIYLLAQSPANELRTLTESEAVARLFACSFPLFYDPNALAFTVDYFQKLVRRVPVRELRFTRDRAAVDLVMAEPHAA